MPEGGPGGDLPSDIAGGGKKFVRIAESWITRRHGWDSSIRQPARSAARKVFRCNNLADSDLSA
jgi:hypothetical protein